MKVVEAIFNTFERYRPISAAFVFLLLLSFWCFVRFGPDAFLFLLRKILAVSLFASFILVYDLSYLVYLLLPHEPVDTHIVIRATIHTSEYQEIAGKNLALGAWGIFQIGVLIWVLILEFVKGRQN